MFSVGPTQGVWGRKCRAELWGRVLEEGWGWMWPSWQEGVQLLSSKAVSESLQVVFGEGVWQ